jgi:hypothetical protein
LITDYYTQSAVIYARTTSTTWGTEPGWSTAPTTVAAAINPSSGRIAFAGQKDTPIADHKMFCGSTVSIAAGNKVTCGGSTFDVVFVKDTLAMGHHKTVYLKLNSRAGGR